MPSKFKLLEILKISEYNYKVYCDVLGNEFVYSFELVVDQYPQIAISVYICEPTTHEALLEATEHINLNASDCQILKISKSIKWNIYFRSKCSTLPFDFTRALDEITKRNLCLLL